MSKTDFRHGRKVVSFGTAIISLTDNSGGTGTDILADSNDAVTGVDGTGSNAASKVDVDARLVTIANSIASLRDKIEEIILSLEADGTVIT